MISHLIVISWCTKSASSKFSMIILFVAVFYCSPVTCLRLNSAYCHGSLFTWPSCHIAVYHKKIVFILNIESRSYITTCVCAYCTAVCIALLSMNCNLTLNVQQSSPTLVFAACNFCLKRDDIWRQLLLYWNCPMPKQDLEIAIALRNWPILLNDLVMNSIVGWRLTFDGGNSEILQIRCLSFSPLSFA